MAQKQEQVSRSITFTEFSESCRAKFAETMNGTRDHQGNHLLTDPKVKHQLKLHKDDLER